MYNRDNERQQYEDWHRHGTERGWFNRAADEFRSWFGDEDAERRRRMDEMERGGSGRWGDVRYENARPAWQDRNYSGVSPRGYDIEERGRYGMEMGRANREHWNYGGNARDYDYATGGRGRYGYGRSPRDYDMPYNRNEEVYGYGREGYGMQRRGGLGHRFFNEPNRDWDRDYDEYWDRPNTRFGNERGTMFGGMHRGRGPRNFQRSDERILDEIHQILTFHPDVDASDIEILVDKGVVTLRGKVEDRRSKRLAEDLCEEVYGVREIRNELHTEHGIFGRSDETNATQPRNTLLKR